MNWGLLALMGSLAYSRHMEEVDELREENERLRRRLHRKKDVDDDWDDDGVDFDEDDWDDDDIDLDYDDLGEDDDY